MTDILASRKRPEEVELDEKKRELAALEAELVERELGLANLHAELAAFQALYVRVVGVLYTELDSIEAEIAEYISRTQPSDEDARAKASRARAKADASQSDYEETLALKSRELNPSQTLKSLYREVAKRVHPDLVTDPEDRARRQRLMAEANRAYEMGDENRLRAILEEYENSPESVSGEGVAAVLIRVIRKIAQVKRRVAEIAIEREEVVRSNLYILSEKMMEAAKQGRDLLQEMAEGVKDEIERARQQLEGLRKAA